MMFAFLFLGSVALADSLDATMIQRITKARTAEEVRRTQAQWDEIRVLRRACRFQLQRKSIPVQCYEAAEREAALGLRSASDLKMVHAQLDRRCLSSAHEWSRIEFSDRSTSLTSRCRAAVDKALDLKEYKRQDSADGAGLE